MAKIIAFANQKGGVAKTTSAINIAAGLAHREFKVLVVDLDPQANLSTGLGVNPSVDGDTIATVLAQDDASLADAIYETEAPNLQVVPSSARLQGVEDTLSQRFLRELILQRAITPELRSFYDYIVLDSPRNLGVLTANALMAATHVIIPAAMEFYSLQGLSMLLARLELAKRANTQLDAVRVLATRYRSTTSLSKQVLDELRTQAADGRIPPMFATVIKELVKIAEAPAFGQSVFDYDPKGEGASLYARLVDEVTCL